MYSQPGCECADVVFGACPLYSSELLETLVVCCLSIAPAGISRALMHGVISQHQHHCVQRSCWIFDSGWLPPSGREAEGTLVTATIQVYGASVTYNCASYCFDGFLKGPCRNFAGVTRLLWSGMKARSFRYVRIILVCVLIVCFGAWRVPYLENC
jgi:hypothetical protein